MTALDRYSILLAPILGGIAIVCFLFSERTEATPLLFYYAGGTAAGCYWVRMLAFGESQRVGLGPGTMCLIGALVPESEGGFFDGAVFGLCIYPVAFEWRRVRLAIRAPRMTRNEARLFRQSPHDRPPPQVHFQPDFVLERCKVAADSLQSFPAGNSPELQMEMEKGLEQLSAASIVPLVQHCLGRLIAAELDWRSTGSRGLGRLTEHFPRLGSLGRSQFYLMGESELEEIQGLLLDMMLHGYMFLFWGTDETKVERWSKQDRWEVLYEWWLPSVYCNNRLQPSAKMLVGMKRIGQGPVEALRKFLWEHAIDHPKLPEIFDQYLIAGHNLRAVQYIE